jgi:hypothetical protein
VSDQLPVFLADSARVAAAALTAEQRTKLVFAIRCIQRDSELGLPYTVAGDVSGRTVVVPGDDAVPGMTLGYRIDGTQIRIVHIVAGP